MALFPGNVVADRFVIETLAATGGMGWVYRATDQHAGEKVAVKVLRTDVLTLDDESRERFLREARVLAQLSHPGIIRYVAHGMTPSGAPFLAMEWLVGETLSQRLGKGVLSVADAVAVGRATAEALAEAHRVGVVHRDVKPSNLLLAGGDVGRVKLIDFGVARLSLGARELTRTGFAVGTATYMAPEQARGMVEIDGRADLYALGVVLYKALIGEPPFSGGDLLAILAKVLLQAAPSARARREDVPPALDDLIGALLAKEPGERPATAGEVARALSEIDIGDAQRVSVVPSVRLTRREQRLIGLVAVRPPSQALDASQTAATIPTQPREPSPLDTAVARFGGRVEHLEGGGAIIVVVARGSGTDLAAAAARCALAIQPLAYDACIAVATGSAELTGDLPEGEVIERATTLADTPGTIHLDEVTTGLLDDRFVVGADARGATLMGERAGSEVVRLLVGRPTPCVGRERELASLIGLAEECARESSARAVVLVGPPGAGKSRLRHELVRAASQRQLDASVWIARGDPIAAGAHLEMIRQLVRAARPERADLREDAARVRAFLKELLDPQTGDTDDLQVRAARANPVLMGDQMRLAWEDLLRAECTHRLVILVLEDLHWSDPTTVAWIDAALAQLSDHPLFVLATARNDVDDVFPRLWEKRVTHRMVVPPLGRRACEVLIRQVLADQPSDAEVLAMIEQSAGNAFFLEELIRAASEGRSGEAPGTIVAMVQAQLEKLGDFPRRVLRAASVFGQTFSREGVKELLKDVRSEEEIDRALSELIERELVRRRAGGEEHAFRHALVREASYASLTPAGARAAHRLAGKWLERQGRSSPLVLAEHYERGGDATRAAAAFVGAAEQAIEGNDFARAVDHARRALDFPRVDAFAARLALATAHRWRGSPDEAYANARAAMDAAEPGGARWYHAAVERIHAGFRSGRMEDVRVLAEEIIDDARHASEGARIRALGALAGVVAHLPEKTTLDRVLACVDADVGDAVPPELVADVEIARSMRAHLDGDYERALEHMDRRRSALLRTGNLREAAAVSNSLGFEHMVIGDDQAAEAALNEGMEMARRMSLPRELAQCRANLALVVARLRGAAAALPLASESLAAFREQRDEPMEASSLLDLGTIHLQAGDLDLAEAHLREGLLVAERANPLLLVYARALLARVLLARGRNDEALEHARWSYEQREGIALRDPSDASVDIAYATALAASDRTDEARVIVSRAREALQAVAGRIRDETRKRAFLERVPENRELAKLFDRLG